MRIIVHCDSPDEMTFAQESVATSIREGYASCGYRRGEVSAFVYRNKTGWTVRVFSPALNKPEGQ